MLAVVFEVTVTVFTVKVTDVAPAGIVTVAGRVALVESDANVMVSPPVGAGPVRVTVPVDEVPPVTDVGLSVTESSVGALMMIVA